MNTEEIIKKIPDIKIVPKTSKNQELIIARYNGSWEYYSPTKAEHYAAKKYFTSSNVLTLYADPIAYKEAVYFEYIPDINCVACVLCKIDTRIPLVNTKVDWIVEDIFFITERKECITNYGGAWCVVTDKISKYLPFNIMAFPGIDNVSDINPNRKNENLQEAFSHLFPVAYIKTSTAVKINNTDILVQFLNFKEKEKKSGPKQNLIDELTSIELEKIDIKDCVGGNTERSERTNWEIMYTYVKISPVKEGVCCIRYILCDKNNSQTIIENVRIYVDKKSAIACKKNNKGEYVQFRLCSGKNNFKASKILDFDPKILEDTMLQYFGTIFSDFAEAQQSMAIWSFLQYPILEKLYKMGLKNLLISGFDNWEANPTSALEGAFGSIDVKAKNVYKALGINKYQFEKFKALNKYSPNGYKIIVKIKQILANGGNIDTIDNDTFDILYNEYSKQTLKPTKGSFNVSEIDNVLKNLNDLYSTKTMLNLCPDIFKMYNDSDRSWSSSKNYIGLYMDYLNMVKRLNDTRNYRPKYDSYNDIKDMHDAAVAVYNLKAESYKLEAFMKQSKKWEDFVYEGKEFSVIAPKHPGEIANEGITLHHCVKSYIDRIIGGWTNIVFIRKNEELDKPFFTVEVSNSGNIEQVHGFGNRNADTEPGLEDFVKEWAKHNKLKVTNFNKVR